MKKIISIFLATILIMVGLSVLHNTLYEPGYATADDIVTRIIKVDKDNIIISEEIVEDEDVDDSDDNEPQDSIDEDDNTEPNDDSDKTNSLDKEYYYFYNMLSSREQDAYKQMLKGIRKCTKSDIIPEPSINGGQLIKIKNAVYYDHPELFWYDGSVEYSYTSSLTSNDPEDAMVNFYSLGYNKLANDLGTNKENFDSACSEILNDMNEKNSVEDKERYLVEALTDIVTYESDGFVVDQTSYGAVVDHKAVCAGYARATQYLCQKAGIKTYYCTGTALSDGGKGNHAWNVILIGDKYYNLDVTWCDTSEYGYLNEDYYNVLDSKIADDHFRDEEGKKLPKCK